MKATRNNGRNRQSLDIVGEMLSISSVRTKKTKIMYRANLSFQQVDKYLKVLLESGLLEHEVDSGYLITGKGIEFLKYYKAYQKRSEHLKEEIGRNIEDRLWLEKMVKYGKKA